MFFLLIDEFLYTKTLLIHKQLKETGKFVNFPIYWVPVLSLVN